MERKKAIRKELITKRNQIPQKNREVYSEKILSALLAHPWFLQAEAICTYISFGSEVDTLKLCQVCLEGGKRLYCPKVVGKGRMEFYPLFSMDALEEGYGGIKEPPVIKKTMEPVPPENTLIIMPLVGFDEEGNRLGYGGGYYDRYLMDKQNIPTIALAFEEQCFRDGLPAEGFDIRPAVILTPDRCIRRKEAFTQDGKKERRADDVSKDGRTGA